jgi:two-component system, cell cycle response regulator
MGGRILVIDDDEDTCGMLCRLLGAGGYEVDARPGGRAGLEAFAAARHDVVITDIRMPDLDGIEVLRALRAIDPGVCAIVYSAVLEDTTRLAIDALRGGAVDYLIKPLVDLGDLECAVETAFKKRAVLRDSEERLRDLERRARTDALTGLSNRHDLEQRLAEEFSRLGRSLEGLSLAILDIDHFKEINDTFGHPEGDRVIEAVARVLRENCRAYDIKARFGGDEFVVVMPDTRLDQGIAVAEKIRRSTSQLPLLPNGGPVRVTLSAGVTATSPFEVVTPEEMIRRADLALYEAKQAGRDRTIPWVQGDAAAQVLIADANPADARRLVEMCSTLGFRADWVSTANDAVTRAAAFRHALALVNITLPDLDGAETVSRIRDVSPMTRAALLADASPAGVGVLEALARFPVTIARKPISLDSLRTLLSEARLRI